MEIPKEQTARSPIPLSLTTLDRVAPYVPFSSVLIAAFLFGLAYLVLFVAAKPQPVDKSLVSSLTVGKATEQDRALGTIQELTARLAWGAAEAVQTGVLLFAIVYFWIIQHRSLYDRPNLSAGLIAISLLVGAAVFLHGRLSNQSPCGTLPTATLLVVVDGTENRVLGWALDFENGLAAVLGASCAIAVGTVLGSSRWLQEADFERQIQSIRHLLNAATVALTVGVLQIFFEYRWVAAVVFPVTTVAANKALPDFGSMIAASFTFAAGSALSLFLVACFVPAAAIIKYRVDRTNGLPGRHPFRFDASKLWQDALKITAPILAAAPLAAFLKVSG